MRGIYPNLQQNRCTDWQTRFEPVSTLISIVNFPVQYDLTDLKMVALRNIERNICKCDIVSEAFSVFASRCV